jgi:DNA-directed RNA polymerase specialized sigma24 family protein
MAVSVMADAARPKWTLTQEAFEGLLASLSSDRDAAAARYLEIRRNLVRLFEWRGCSTPDEYADETMNRCARKITEGEGIRDLATYSIGVARMLLTEMGRVSAREPRALSGIPEPRVSPQEREGRDAHAECLRKCLGQLSAAHRDLILNYYMGDKGDQIRKRKSLMQSLRIPASTLRMRALRIRESLQLCTKSCVQGGSGKL